MASSSSTAPRHPIGVVSRRTGLKPGLIRAWERRYSAVEPDRTETNRRLYSDLEVERLLLLREVTRLGHNISQVADLPSDELEELIEQEGDVFPSPDAERSPSNGSSGEANPVGPYRTAIAPALRSTSAPTTPLPRWDEEDEQVASSMVDIALSAVRRLDARDLEVQLERGALALSRLGVVTDLLGPLLRRVGDLWAEGQLRPVHVHLLTAVARSYIHSVQRAYQPPAAAPHLVVTTPTGQAHELGAMMASVVANAQGWQVTYLGPDLAAEEIAAAARACGAKAVALSLVHPADDPRLPEELHRLRRLLEPETRLLVGGGAAGAYRQALETISADLVDDLAALRQQLNELRSVRQVRTH